MSKPDNKAFVNFFFEQVDDENFKCKNVKCGNKLYKQKAGSGYSNLITHLRGCVPNYQSIYKQATLPNATNNVQLKFLTHEEEGLFNLMEWVIMRNIPLSEVENPITRKALKMKAVSIKTLRKYILNLADIVKDGIKRILPEKFGIIFDGWSDGLTHYVGIFACYSPGGKYTEVLLAIRPMINEEKLDAEEHIKLFNATLESYGKYPGNVCVLIGDNASTNRKVAKDMGIPLIGCHSHKFNLALDQWVSSQQGLGEALEVVSSLMKQASTLKRAAKLRTLTELAPVKNNKTRWNSNFYMLKRYFKIQQYLNVIPELQDYFPTRHQQAKLETAMKDFDNFQSITMELQKEGLTLHQCRQIFDEVLHDYPSMVPQLGPTSNLVHAPDFESGVIKIAQNQFCLMSEQEVHAVRHLKTENQATEQPIGQSPVNQSYFDRIQKRQKLKAAAQGRSGEEYVDITFITGTSNSCERLFSAAKHVLTDTRKCMSPIMFESLIFLQKNRAMWDQFAVAAAAKMQVQQRQEEADDEMYYAN